MRQREVPPSFWGLGFGVEGFIYIYIYIYIFFFFFFFFLGGGGGRRGG